MVCGGLAYSPLEPKHSAHKEELIMTEENQVSLANVIRVRTGGDVERCHGVRHQGSYSVSSHSWGVAMLMYHLWPEDFPRLGIHCLAHDVPEAWVGDIPAPTKRYDPAIKPALADMERRIFSWLSLPCDEDLSPEDAAKFKACDQLELYLWAMEQLEQGNSHAASVVTELESFFAEVPLPARATELLRQMRLGVTSGAAVHSTSGVIKLLSESESPLA